MENFVVCFGKVSCEKKKKNLLGSDVFFTLLSVGASRSEKGKRATSNEQRDAPTVSAPSERVRERLGHHHGGCEEKAGCA